MRIFPEQCNGPGLPACVDLISGIWEAGAFTNQQIGDIMVEILFCQSPGRSCETQNFREQ